MALERARTLDVVVFDKTARDAGQAERGQHRHRASGSGTRCASPPAPKANSEHMIAQGDRDAAASKSRGLLASTIPSDPRARSPGDCTAAVLARSAGHACWAGAGRAPGGLAERRACGVAGQPAVYLVQAAPGKRAGFAIADIIRRESAGGRQRPPRAGGVRAAMMTETSATRPAGRRRVGIDETSLRCCPSKGDRGQSAPGAGWRAGGDGRRRGGRRPGARPGRRRDRHRRRHRRGTRLRRRRVIADRPTRCLGSWSCRANYRKMDQNLGVGRRVQHAGVPIAAGALAGVGIVLPAWGRAVS